MNHRENNQTETIKKLKSASPLALPQLIAQCEFYDQTSSRQILDDAIREFEKNGGTANSILKPVMLSVADGLIEALPNTRQLRRKGLTPQSIYNECEAFSYQEEITPPLTDEAYLEYKNARSFQEDYAGQVRGKYDRIKMQNQSVMEKYKETAVKANGNNKNLTDEYTGRQDITAYRNNADQRRNDPTGRFQAQPDHIVPLKEIHKKIGGNYALSDHDLRIIANIDGNLALTSGQINQTKLMKTNSQYVKDNPSLDAATQASMLAKEKEAQRVLDTKTNEIVLKNLASKGAVSGTERAQAYHEFEQKNSRKPTPREKEAIARTLQIGKTGKVYADTLKNAGSQAMNCAVGNVIMFALKPIYFELKDSFSNGFVTGVGASDGIETIKIRFTRVKDYVVKNAAAFIGDNLWEFIKGLVSSLLEGIISLFIGIFKQILKIIKEGFRIFVQSSKIIWGKDAASMTPAQKGDALIKLVGGAVISIAGIGIEALLNKIGIGTPWSTVLATMLSGIAASLFMYLLDKADLFSVKAERREQRIKEIFEERIADLKSDTAKFNTAVLEKLREQRIAYEQLVGNVNNALADRDMECVDKSLDALAGFFHVVFPYEDSRSFIAYVKQHKVIQIGKGGAAVGNA